MKIKYLLISLVFMFNCSCQKGSEKMEILTFNPDFVDFATPCWDSIISNNYLRSEYLIKREIILSNEISNKLKNLMPIDKNFELDNCEIVMQCMIYHKDKHISIVKISPSYIYIDGEYKIFEQDLVDLIKMSAGI